MAPPVTRPKLVNGGLAPLPDHLPPHSVEAEQAALGSALISRTAAEYVVGHLRASDFHLTAHQRVYEAIASLLTQDGGAVDVMSVPEEMKRRGTLEGVGGLPYIHSLTETVPTAKHVEHYAGVVREKSELRDAETFSGTIARAVADGEEPEAIYARMDRFITGKRARRSVGKGPQAITAVELLALNIPPMRWAIEGLMPEGVTLLVAAPKIGKSWMAYQAGIAVAAGGVAFSYKRVEKGEALLLMLEDTKRRAKSRIGQLLADSEPPPGLFLMTECPRMDEGGRVFLESWLSAHPDCRLVVIDTLQKFRTRQSEKGSMYAEDYEAVGAIKAIADKFGVSFIVIHHVNKSRSEDIFDSVSGSNGVAGAADGCLIIGRERGSKEAVLHVTGRDIEERKLALRFDDLTAWEILGDADEHANTRERDEVLSLLRDAGRPMKSAEIAQRLGQSGSTVRSKLYRMVSASILSVESGWFSLTERYRKAPEGAATAAGAAVQHCSTFGPEPGWDTGDDAAVAALVSPAAVAAPVAVTPQNGLPFAPDPPERSIRAALRLEALAKGFPELSGDWGKVQATEEDWAYVCREWHEDTLLQVQAALRGGRGDGLRDRGRQLHPGTNRGTNRP